MLRDLTLPLAAGMPGFPGYPGFEARRLQSHDADGKLSRQFAANSHQGTHVDAPSHFVEGGATLDDLALDRMVGPATVVDLRHARGEAITAGTLDDAAPDLDPGARVLLLTGDVDHRFAEDGFFEEAAVLTESAAEWLLDRDVAMVGNDFLTESIDGPERPVHHALLGAGVPIVEYLCNADAVVDHGTVEFTCLPIKLVGFEAAPVRAIADVEG